MRTDIRTGIAWLAVAVGVLLLTAAGVYPAAMAARALSADGILSPDLVGLLHRSQQTLGAILLALSPFAFAASRVGRTADRALAAGSDRAWFAVAAGLSLAATYAVQSIAFGNIPHVTDASSHLFQAKVFALGRLFAPLPPCPEHFYQYNVFMTQAGRWFTVYPPGHALALALALKAGLVHVALPAAQAALVVVASLLVRRFYGQATARAFAAVAATSPLLILLGASYMSHTTALLFAAAGFACAARALDDAEKKPLRCFMAVASGFLLGMTAITRPQDALLLAVPAALALALAFRSTRNAWPAAVLPFLAGVAVPAVLLGFWNARAFGSPFALGYGHSAEQLIEPVMQPFYGFSAHFDFHRGTTQTTWTLLRFNQALLGWPCALAVAALALCSRKLDRRDLVCAASVAWTIAFFFPYFYYGHEFEARFYAAAAPFAIVLAVRGVRRFAEMAGRGVAALAVAALALHGACYYWPAYLWPKYANDYEFASPAAQRLLEDESIGRALVLVDKSGPSGFRYTSGFALNDPLLTNRVIFARDIEEGTDCLTNAFPDRKILRW